MVFIVKKGKKKNGGLINLIKGFFYGLAMHNTYMYTLKSRINFENMLMLTLMGDLIGVSILPPIYRLKLLPYTLVRRDLWKIRLIRAYSFFNVEHLRGIFPHKDLTDRL